MLSRRRVPGLTAATRCEWPAPRPSGSGTRSVDAGGRRREKWICVERALRFFVDRDAPQKASKPGVFSPHRLGIVTLATILNHAGRMRIGRSTAADFASPQKAVRGEKTLARSSAASGAWATSNRMGGCESVHKGGHSGREAHCRSDVPEKQLSRRSDAGTAETLRYRFRKYSMPCCNSSRVESGRPTRYRPRYWISSSEPISAGKSAVP